MKRPHLLSQIRAAFRVHPAVCLLGPRQSGKTTLAKAFLATSSPGNHIYFDLENPKHLAALENPMLAMEERAGTIVLDEVQRKPELFPVLRVLIDQKKKGRRFLILGSASPQLLKQTSETLAGRIQYIEVTPFQLREAGDLQRHWLRGGFPRSYLAKTSRESSEWRRAYISTFLERDIPQLGIRIPSMQLRRFWMMLSHYHGQIANYSELGNALQLSDKTVKTYADLLSATFMIRQVQPWWENISKRQIKSPKLFIRDSGLLHAFLDVRTMHGLQGHPKIGASWEGYALEEIFRMTETPQEAGYFWGVHGQGELDLLLFRKGKRIGYEVKYSDRPRLTDAMKMAMKILKLDELHVIVPGIREPYRLDARVWVRALEHVS